MAKSLGVNGHSTLFVRGCCSKILPHHHSANFMEQSSLSSMTGLLKPLLLKVLWVSLQDGRSTKGGGADGGLSGGGADNQRCSVTTVGGIDTLLSPCHFCFHSCCRCCKYATLKAPCFILAQIAGNSQQRSHGQALLFMLTPRI